MFLHVSALPSAGVFFRAGLRFDSAGSVLHPDAIGPEALARIEAEPNLRVRAATAEEARPTMLDALFVAIPALDAKAFGATGAPHLKALREATGWGDLLTKEIVDEAMAALAAAGFEAPKDQPKG